MLRWRRRRGWGFSKGMDVCFFVLFLGKDEEGIGSAA